MMDIVVIGRNDSLHLQSCFESINNIEDLNKIIYIDSNSTDESIDIAMQYADVVYQITNDEICSASLARNIGTIISDAEWIMFLDSDMTITAEFKEWLNQNKTLLNKTDYSGFIGNYIMHGIDERNNIINTHIQKKENKEAKYLAGASLLKRIDIIKAGNWPKFLFSTEEQDLYTRMKNKEMKIFEVDIDQITHRDTDHDIKTKFKELYFPIRYKNYIGTFQGTYKASKEKNWRHFTYNNKQYITLLSLIGFIFAKKRNIKFFSVMSILLVNKFNLKQIIVSVGNSIRILFGITQINAINKINSKDIEGKLLKGVINNDISFN